MSLTIAMRSARDERTYARMRRAYGRLAAASRCDMLNNLCAALDGRPCAQRQVRAIWKPDRIEMFARLAVTA